VGEVSLPLHNMAPRIYHSELSDIAIHNTSLYTRLFASRAPQAGDVGGFPGSLKALIDAATGTSLTRAQVKELTLSFAYGLRDHPSTRTFAKRGDTIMIYSPNCLAWPVVLYGSTLRQCFVPNLSLTVMLCRRRRWPPVHPREQRV
jgi:4-coumarate--CoA ligase